MRFSVLTILSLSLFTWAFPQDNGYVFRHLRIADGLASNYVSSIIQDKDGFMWFGTENGLQKYDGYSFTTYHHEPSDSQSIGEDRISNLFQGPDSHIWVKTHSFGIESFDMYRGKVQYPVGMDPRDIAQLHNAGGTFIDTNHKRWFYSAVSFLLQYNLSQQLPIRSADSDKWQWPPMVCDATFDRLNQVLWMASSQGVCAFNFRKMVLFSKTNNPEHLPVFEITDPVSCLFLDKDNHLWISTPAYTILRYDIAHRQLMEYSRGKGFITGAETDKDFFSFDCAVQDKNGFIWFGVHNATKIALLRYNPLNEDFTAISASSTDPSKFQCGQNINCIFEDREGNIWIGTDKGINIVNPEHQKFFTVANDPSDVRSFPPNEVTSFLQQKNGDIWVSTWGGGTLLLDTNLKIKKRFYDQASLGFFAARHSANLAWSLLENTDGKIWIGCQHAFLLVYDQHKNKMSYQIPGELQQKTIKKMAMDNRDNIWLALHTAIARWQKKDNTFTYYDRFIPHNGISAAIVNDILIDHRGQVWVATDGLGLQRFDPDAGKFNEIYFPDENNKFSIASSVINTLCAIDDSILAIGTSGGGINLMNTTTKNAVHITTSQGLPSNDITSMYRISKNELWVTSRNVLSKIDLQNKKITNFGYEDGISDKEFGSSIGFYRLQDGRLLTGTTNGFIYFNPDSIRENAAAPDVIITRLIVFGENFYPDSESHFTKPLKFSYKQNFMTIEFCAPGFLSSKINSYYYMLEGIDKEWVNNGNNRVATYTALPPGNYKFRVKSEGRNGLFSKRISELLFVINPPVWKTWWSICICLAVGAGILFGI